MVAIGGTSSVGSLVSHILGATRMQKSRAGAAVFGFDVARCAHAAPVICTMGVAGDLVYAPINPSFGGNAFSSSHLLDWRTRRTSPSGKRTCERKKSGKRSSSANFDRFMQTLQSRLYPSLVQQVSNAILGENAQRQGTIKFKDQGVFFERTGNEIRLAITDFTTGR